MQSVSEIRTLALTPEMTFAEASELWLKLRTLNIGRRTRATCIRVNTEKSYAQYSPAFCSGLRTSFAGPHQRRCPLTGLAVIPADATAQQPITVTFAEAVASWHEESRSRMTPSTEKSYLKCAGSLVLFFGAMRVCDMRPEHFEEYQQARLAGTGVFVRRSYSWQTEAGPCPAGPTRVKQELSLLKTILVLVGAWRLELQEYYMSQGRPR